MMEILFQIMSIFSALLACISTLLLARSNVKFTKGELQKTIENFIWGTIFMFGAMAAQVQVDILNLTRTPIDMIRYFFLLVAFLFFLSASFRVYKMSRVFGFASEEVPKKLKKVLKS